MQFGLAQVNTLKVEVSNIYSGEGDILLALFNKKDGFPDNPSKAFQVKEVPSKKGKITVLFTNVPTGTYAISVFHDKNSDKKLNTNFLGIPREDYGFSTNIRFRTRAPHFDEASFVLKNSMEVSITIK
jgi:uncharacterized protein (DUF2141 family)